MPAPPVPEPEPETTTPSVWTRPDPYGGPIDNPAPVGLPALLAEILAVDLTDSAPLTRLEQLSKLGALDAVLHAIRLATIASLSPALETDHWAERHVVEELRLAMGVDDRYADALLDQARAVFGTQPTHTAPDPAAADAEPAETEPSTTGIGRHWSTALVVDPAPQPTVGTDTKRRWGRIPGTGRDSEQPSVEDADRPRWGPGACSGSSPHLPTPAAAD